MKNIKFMLIGCGRIGARHADHMENFGSIAAVCDIDKEKADKFGKKYNSKIFYNVNDLIKSNINADVVSICSPNGLHAQHSIASLKAGYNVLCEKPMAINSIDCGLMIQQAEKSNKRLFVIKQNRFNPPVVELKKLLDNNILGQVYSVQLNCFWNRNAEY